MVKRCDHCKWLCDKYVKHGGQIWCKVCAEEFGLDDIDDEEEKEGTYFD